MESVLSIEDYGLKARLAPGRQKAAIFREFVAKRRTSAFVRARFSVLAAAVDACVILVSTILSGAAYHGIFYGIGGLVSEFSVFGLFLALLFVMFNVLRNEYELSNYLAFSGQARRVILVWSLAFLTVLVFEFATKQSAAYSRASALIVYGVGAFALTCFRAVVVTRVKTSAIVGRISALRVVLVGPEAELKDFTNRYMPWLFGIDIVASFVLRGAETLEDDIALAGASARVLKPDDIFILLPWSDTSTIEACVAAFMKVPASIHLGPQPILDRFSNVGVSRMGKIYSLQLVRRPLTLVEVVIKRTFDLAIAIPLLVGLVPLFVAVAVAIRLDGPGPVLFMQRRYGFNQETFRIVKFRSMNVTEDGRGVTAAKRQDPRVTRVGRFLRRYNIDELPQLLNVIRGEMSLVGPRPHALVHNQQFDETIADYARRHNVKPGITGWAQIHGLRGEVRSDEAMSRRVQHDLYYIDNWTVGLDLRILAMTLLSPKAFANAY